MLEKQIEAKVCKYAKEKGLLVYKFVSPARAAVPDRLFILPSGFVFFIEFKRTGKKLTPAQERESTRLQEYNMTVFEVDTVEKGIRIIDNMLVIYA